MYDESRDIPGEILERTILRLREERVLILPATILDVGCGTGQLTLALAGKGFTVIGVDISGKMIDIASSKIKKGMKVSFRVGDARRLDFKDNTFDATIASKLFQHIRDWQGAIEEILRVTKPGGYFIYINETGAFRNKVRKKAESLANQPGYAHRYLGVTDRQTLKDYFLSKGCVCSTIDTSSLKWHKKITHGRMFKDFEDRLFAEFWYMPEDDYTSMLMSLREWIDTQPHGMETIEETHPSLRVDTYLNPRN